jgi:hypothetical protein
MNDKIPGNFAMDLPGTMTYITDRDYLVDIQDSTMHMLVEKPGHIGKYLAVKTTGIDVHVINKQSLSRFIDGGSGV